MAFAAASDLFTMTISNRVSLALLGGFLGLAVLSGMGLHDILLHVGAGAAVLAVAFACFAFGWIGGGDAKVAAGAALWFGFAHLLDYLVYASLFGGALTLALLQFRQWPLPYALGGQAWLLKLHAKGTGVGFWQLQGSLYFPNDFTTNLSKELKLLSIQGAVLNGEEVLQIRRLVENIEKIFRWFDNERRQAYAGTGKGDC